MFGKDKNTKKIEIDLFFFLKNMSFEGGVQLVITSKIFIYFFSYNT